MVEASIIKMAVMPEPVGTVFYAVAEYGSDMINVRAPFEFDTMDHEEFLDELRERIAEGFDIPKYHVDLKREVIIGKMMMWTERFRSMGFS